MRVKIFHGLDSRHINMWLYDHPDIEVVSTNITCNEYAHTYVILYKTKDKPYEQDDLA